MRLGDLDALKEQIRGLGLSYDNNLEFVLDAIDNAPTVKSTFKPIAEVKFNKEQLQEIVDKAIIRCQVCKHQKKYWHEDRRMKEKGYWIYGCDLIDDSFIGTPVVLLSMR